MKLPPGSGAWPFAVSTLYVDGRVVVRVGGSVDTVTAPLLHSALQHLADDGHVDVTLDLEAIDVLDAAGARTLASIAARLHGLDHQLTVRSASDQVRATLRLGACDDLIDFTVEEPSSRRADRREPGAATVAAELLEAEIGPRAHPHAVVDAALRLVTSLAQATVAGADGVSVSLHRHGAVTTVAASDDRIAQMDRDQYATGQGPCLAAAAGGRAVSMPVLSKDDRWPEFTSRARMGGIASILSSPLMAHKGPVGALNMYSRAERAFGPEQRQLASLFAEQASMIIEEAAVHPARPDVAERLHAGLRDRQVIAQAQGVLMARRGVTAEEAHSILRTTARAGQVTVVDEAAQILASTRGGHASGLDG